MRATKSRRTQQWIPPLQPAPQTCPFEEAAGSAVLQLEDRAFEYGLNETSKPISFLDQHNSCGRIGARVSSRQCWASDHGPHDYRCNLRTLFGFAHFSGRVPPASVRLARMLMLSHLRTSDVVAGVLTGSGGGACEYEEDLGPEYLEDDFESADPVSSMFLQIKKRKNGAQFANLYELAETFGKGTRRGERELRTRHLHHSHASSFLQTRRVESEVYRTHLRVSQHVRSPGMLDVLTALAPGDGWAKRRFLKMHHPMAGLGFGTLEQHYLHGHDDDHVAVQTTAHSFLQYRRYSRRELTHVVKEGDVLKALTDFADDAQKAAIEQFSPMLVTLSSTVRTLCDLMMPTQAPKLVGMWGFQLYDFSDTRWTPRGIWLRSHEEGKEFTKRQAEEERANCLFVVKIWQKTRFLLKFVVKILREGGSRSGGLTGLQVCEQAGGVCLENAFLFGVGAVLREVRIRGEGRNRTYNREVSTSTSQPPSTPKGSYEKG